MGGSWVAMPARRAGVPTIGVMRERKALMDAKADAFLALPGGLGTCEELFEVWTSRYLRMHENQ